MIFFVRGESGKPATVDERYCSNFIKKKNIDVAKVTSRYHIS